VRGKGRINCSRGEGESDRFLGVKGGKPRRDWINVPREGKGLSFAGFVSRGKRRRRRSFGSRRERERCFWTEENHRLGRGARGYGPISTAGKGEKERKMSVERNARGGPVIYGKRHGKKKHRWEWSCKREKGLIPTKKKKKTPYWDSQNGNLQ